MAATDADETIVDDDSEPTRSVCALKTSAGRTVFTEDGNDDAWISTDTTVPVER